MLAFDQSLLVPLLAGVVGGFFRGFAGFGFGMAAVPILIVSLLPVHAIPAVLIHEVAFGAATAPGVWKSVAWPCLGPLVAGSLVGTPIGLAMLQLVPAGIIRPVIGLLVLASVITLWTVPKLRIRLTHASYAAAGMVSGVLNGSTAASGPPAIILLFASDRSPTEIRGLLVLFILASAAIALAISAASGLIVLPVIVIAATMLPGVLVGALAGQLLFKRLHTRHYRSISLALLFTVSVVTLGVTLIRSIQKGS